MSIRQIVTSQQFATKVRSLSAWTVTAFLCASGAAHASTIVNVAGTTAGCFGTSCTFSTTSSSGPTYDLTFTGSTFDVLTDGTGSAADFVLGSIARGRTNTPDTTAALPFTLEVTFTLPTGIGGGQNDTFTALITGSSTGGGGPLPVDFDNTWLLFSFVNAFGSGSFQFAVTNDPALNKNNSDQILGSIRNALFTPTSIVVDDPPPIGSVPEPSMLVLLGTAALTLARRRRKSSR